MKLQMNITKKRNYHQPEIREIKLDNEISLQLESAPPTGPGETKNFPENSLNDPYKTNLA